MDNITDYETKEPAPTPMVVEMKEAAQFYANRIAKEIPEYKDIATGFIALLGELAEFVKANHTTGLVWNPKGQSPDDAIRGNLSYARLALRFLLILPTKKCNESPKMEVHHQPKVVLLLLHLLLLPISI
jgi:hypothetical protein